MAGPLRQGPGSCESMGPAAPKGVAGPSLRAAWPRGGRAQVRLAVERDRCEREWRFGAAVRCPGLLWGVAVGRGRWPLSWPRAAQGLVAAWCGCVSQK